MLVVKTPLRISFFGGGTDLPAFTEREEGAALAASINLYNYVVLNRTQRPVRFIHEDVAIGSDNMTNNIAAAVIDQYNLRFGYDIASMSDVHAVGAGLGGSSAFTVSLLNAVMNEQQNFNKIKDFVRLIDLVKEACRIEIDVCGYPIGVQDQYQVAYGGLNHWNFLKGDKRIVQRANYWLDDISYELSRHLVLMWSGIPRTKTSGTILQNQQTVMRNDQSKFDLMLRIRQRVYDAENCLVFPSRMHNFGELLHDNWMDKKQLTDDLSNPAFDEFYESGRQCGASGGKLLGAGGGGFFLFYIPNDENWRFVQKMATRFPLARNYPFTIVHTGSQVTFV